MENLIICVDRDDDIGKKTKSSGPIIGIDRNIAIANELALADPADSDVNAIFAAVKIAKDLRTEIVTLTGDRRVGVPSDAKIARQLDDLIERFKPEGVILVTDGAEDEQIIPLIESRVKINSVQTVIVRQSQELERAYFKITHFIKEVEEDPNLARLVFGIPGLALILLAIGGAFGIMLHAMNTILAIIGAYLLIKGFGYEEDFFSRTSELLKSLSVEKISTLTYLIAVVVFLVALGYGYDEILREGPTTLIDLAAAFIKGSADLILAAIVITVIGRIIDDYSTNRYLNVRTDLVFLAFAFLMKLTVEAGASFWFEPSGIANFIISVLIGILIFIGVIKITEYLFIEEIHARQRLIDEFKNKEVYNENGEIVGKVNRVLLDGLKFIGIRTGRKKIPKEDIISKEDNIVIRTS
jgi:putative membrane protein